LQGGEIDKDCLLPKGQWQADVLVQALVHQRGKEASSGACVSDDRIVRCASCPGLIVWLKTKNGANMPTDASSVDPEDRIFDHQKHISHFATCPNHNQHRRSK
jgi:hypothetical protein